MDRARPRANPAPRHPVGFTPLQTCPLAHTGRTADPGGAAHVSRVMHETYSDLGCATERLPALALGPRLDLLLARCGLPPAAGTKCLLE